jgi:dihydrofolate reductase
VFVLTHHPNDAQPANGVTFLSCDVAEVVRIGLEAADGKNLEVFSATIGRQLLERGLIDEIDVHIAPVLLGDGIRLFDNPGGASVRLELLNGDDPTAAVNVRYHPVVTGLGHRHLSATGTACVPRALAVAWASDQKCPLALGQAS